eukprot:COSAG04_NODE_9188_length_889_cov_13.013924_1_plen_262_part_10
MQVWHFPGQKLRLGGDALGADPTYLLYLPFGSRGVLRRLDFAAWPRTATFRLKLSPESAKVHASGVEQQAAVGPQVKRRGSAGARVGPSAQVTQSTRLENIRTLDPPSLVALANLTKRFFLRPLVWKTWACGRLRSSYTAARRRINQGGRAGDHSGDEGVRQGVKEGEATKVCGDRCADRNNMSTLLTQAVQQPLTTVRRPHLPTHVARTRCARCASRSTPPPPPSNPARPSPASPASHTPRHQRHIQLQRGTRLGCAPLMA